MKRLALLILLPALVATAGACAKRPRARAPGDTPPLVLFPASLAGIEDARPRFREIVCAVLEARKNGLPDYRPCAEALTTVGFEAPGEGAPVELEPSRRGLAVAVVFGVGFACVEPWLEATGTTKAHLAEQGYEVREITVEALSSSARNAELIRDAVAAMPAAPDGPNLVLVGYSKGAPDILVALATYPELQSRVAAMVSMGGAIGGSLVADATEQEKAEWFRHFPDADCGPGDRGAMEDLRTETRRAWLAAHPLPAHVRYYSLATLPDPKRISRALRSSYDKLAKIDPRNDSQLFFFDQLVPGSTLLGYANADHWAVAIPIARTHPTVGKMLVDQNAYPREALLEAVLRFVEEDLAAR